MPELFEFVGSWGAGDGIEDQEKVGFYETNCPAVDQAVVLDFACDGVLLGGRFPGKDLGGRGIAPPEWAYRVGLIAAVDANGVVGGGPAESVALGRIADVSVCA